MRGEKFWFQAIPDLRSYLKVFRLKNVQNVAISRNNCPGGFDMLERELLSPHNAIE
jgi:hypothetical protein